jgi:hypothetical protein
MGNSNMHSYNKFMIYPVNCQQLLEVQNQETMIIDVSTTRQMISSIQRCKSMHNRSVHRSIILFQWSC